MSAASPVEDSVLDPEVHLAVSRSVRRRSVVVAINSILLGRWDERTSYGSRAVPTSHRPIAPGKAWERRKPCSEQKPLEVTRG